MMGNTKSKNIQENETQKVHIYDLEFFGDRNLNKHEYPLVKYSGNLGKSYSCMPSTTADLCVRPPVNLSTRIKRIHVFQSSMDDAVESTRNGAIAVGVTCAILVAVTIYNPLGISAIILRTTVSVFGASTTAGATVVALTAKDIVYHTFILLELYNGEWLSMELREDGISLQVGSEKELLLETIQGNDRSKHRLLVETGCDPQKARVEDVVDWLYQQEQLSKTYNLISNNCQHFVKRIFSEFSDGNGHIPTWYDRVTAVGKDKIN